MIESAIKYIKTKESFIVPLLLIYLSKPIFMKNLIDFASPYVIFFSWQLKVLYFYLFYIPCWTFINKVTLYEVCFS